jgi:hypothetical protein
MILELEDDDVSASGLGSLLTKERLKQALAMLAARGIRVRTSWLPLLLALIAALPDLIEAIQKFIDAIRPPAPAPTA